MNKKGNFIEETIMPVADKIASNRYLTAISNGFMLVMPLLIIGSMCLLITALPIPGYGNFMVGVFGEHWGDFFLIPFNASMGIMTIFVIIGISYSLAKHYKQDGMSTAVISLVSFFVLTPFVTSFTPEGLQTTYQVGSVIPMGWLGEKGLFVGIISAILATEIVRFVVTKGWVIKMPEGVPPAIAKGFSALIPAAITIFIFGTVRLLFTYTSFGTVHNFIYTILGAPLLSLGNTLGAALIAVFFNRLFWIFGIHGGNVVGSVMDPIWIALSAENLVAFGKGATLPHIITAQFFVAYVYLHLVGLCIALLFVCKSQQCKKIGKLAVLPGLFNIGEPIMFGLPIVLNPIMIIPFILSPLVLTLIAYGSMAIGIVPFPNGVLIPWTTPVIISGFLVSGIRGVILQVIGIIVSFLIYLPFIKALDKIYYKQDSKQKESYETNTDVSVGQ